MEWLVSQEVIVRATFSPASVTHGKQGTVKIHMFTLLRPVVMVETLAALRDRKISSDRNEILHRTLYHSIDKNSDPARRIRQTFFLP